MGWGLNRHFSQILLSRHLEQTCPGLVFTINNAVWVMNISKYLVIGFLKYHASRLKVALPSCESSGV